MSRDFTFIDDIIEGLIRIIEKPVANREKYKIYNIGNNKTENLVDFISILEKLLGKTAKKEMLPMQPGDVIQTYAEVNDLIKDYQYSPNITIDEGLKYFVRWYLNFELK
jgi:UDP-glucuronate 4-epimerase